MSKANSRIAKNTVALYFRMGVTMAVTFFTARETLKLLGVDDYGLNNLVGSIVTMFSFINLSMGTAVRRFYAIEIGQKNEENLAKVFGVGFYLHILVAVVTLFIAEIFAIFFLGKLNIPEERMFAAHVVFQISAISLALNIINVPFAALLRAREELSKIATIEIIQSLLRLVVLYLLFVINFDKLITLSFLNFGVTIFYIVSFVLIAKRYKEVTFKINKDKKLIKEMLSYISFMLFSTLAWLLKDKSIVLMINLFFGLAINGAYAIALQLMKLVNTFAMNFKYSLVPQIMVAYGAGEFKRMFRLIFSGTKITFILMMVISIPMMIETHFLLSIWLDEVPKYAPEFTTLCIIIINISSFTFLISQGLESTSTIKKWQTYIALSYLLSIAIIYIFFKFGFNFYSALYISIVFALIQFGINVYFGKKLLNLDVRLFMKEVVIKCIILFITTIALPLFIINTMPESFIRFVLVVVTTIITLFIMCVCVFFDKNEKDFFKDYITKIGHRFAIKKIK